MARTWIKTNNNQGNVLKCAARDLEATSQPIAPNANVSIYRVLDATGAITLTVNGTHSLLGDRLTILVQATGETTLTIAGDAAPGSVVISAGGVSAIDLINGASGPALFVGLVTLA